jgi:hypothetical protein
MNVLARLLARVALTDRAGHLDDAGDDPPVFVGLLVRDRQPKRVSHREHRSLKVGGQ